MKLRRKNKKSKTIILVILFTLINLSYISKMLKNDLENIVEKNVNKSIYNYIFYMFDKDTLESGNLLDIISLNENSEGDLVSVDYKYNIAYKYLNESMDRLYKNISVMMIDSDYDKTEDGIYFVPVGLVLNNILLERLGFKIPCKINYLSDVDMNFKTNVKNYGINNLLVELLLVINVSNDLMSPGTYYQFGESYEILLASRIIVGNIPNYLGHTIEKSSSILSS